MPGLTILVLAPHPYYVDRGSPIDVDILVRALSQRGDTVDLIVYREGEDREYPGVTIHRAPVPEWVGSLRPGLSWKKLIADLAVFRMARRLIARRRYDVIHAGEEAVFLAMWFRFRRGIPYVYDMDSSIAQQVVEQKAWLAPFRRLFNWSERQAIRKAIAVAPVCNALADLARAAPARHVTTLHDISQFSREDFVPRGFLRDQLGISGTILLYVGNLEPYQGVDLLLEAFARAAREDPEIQLVVAGGSASLGAQYRSKARALGIESRSHFIGPWPARKLGELLAEADILTAPRIRGINTPMKVFPYLHSGRPVLATALPTHTQILDETVCELAPADPEGFARAILRLARDPDRRNRLGAAGRAFVERNHTWAAHRERVNALYQAASRALGLAVVIQLVLTVSR